MKPTKFIVVFSLFSVFAYATLAQTPEATPPPLNAIEEDNSVVKIDSRLVVVPVSVLDASGQPVLGLKAQDFSVLENKKMQEIAEVGDAEKVPLEIAILFDISGTTNPMFEFEQETAAKFLQEVMRPEDRATVFTIGGEARLVQASDTAERSAGAIKSIQPTKQYTAFYDTVRASAEYLEKNTPKGRRKVVLIISDGEDTNSVRIAKAIQDGYASLGKKLDTLDNKSLYEFTIKRRNEANDSERARVLKSLQNADTVFYSINPAGSSYKLNKISQIGQTNMQMFADQTGGTAFLPQFLPIDVKDNYIRESNTRRNTETLESIFRQLANELRAQYLLQYYSNGDYPVNKYIDLSVGLKNSQNYRVRARQGYFVKDQ